MSATASEEGVTAKGSIYEVLQTFKLPEMINSSDFTYG
jgi:hypothetical protein